MRSLLPCALLVLVLTGMAQSNNDSSGANAQLRTYLDPEGEYYVGQLIKYWVEITTSGSFDQAPQYPDLNIDGAIALMPEQLGVNFSTKEKGKSMIGQRQRYVIIPQRTGELLIPELTIKLATKDSQGATDGGEFVTEAISIQAIIPPAAENVPQLVATTSLTIDQAYSQNTENLKVGDAITRRISITADNMLAVALPVIQFEKVSGTSVYPAQPELKDDINRGQYTAQRTDAASYMLEQQGTVIFPEIKIEWWNLDSGKLETTILPEASFDVSENTESPSQNALVDGSEDHINKLKHGLGVLLEWIRLNITYLGLAAIGTYLVMLGWRKFGRVLTGSINDRWRSLKHSEGLAFFKFRYALRFGSRDRARLLFWNWLERMTPCDKVASVAELAARAGDDAFITFFEKIEAAKYGCRNQQQITVSEIDKGVCAFRKRLLSACETNSQDETVPLPLNPSQPSRLRNAG